MKLRRLVFAVCAGFGLVPLASHACTQSEVDAVTSVYVEVGMWGAATNGGYTAAAYERLGERLDSMSSLNTASSVFVTFTYSASLFGMQGTAQVNLCLEREEGQNWESVTTGLTELANILAALINEGIGADFGGGGGGATGNNSTMPQVFPPNSTIVVGGWGSALSGPKRGVVTCIPACN